MSDIFQALGYPISNPTDTPTVSPTQGSPEKDLVDFQADVNYLQYYMERSKEGTTNVLPLPLGKPDANGETTRFVAAAAEQATVIVRFSVMRLGQYPVLPSPVTDDPNMVLLGYKFIDVAPMTLPPYESVLYKVAGEFKYGLRNPGKAIVDGLKVPTTPSYKFKVMRVDATAFQKGLF
jgi:hypothetical protein